MPPKSRIIRLSKLQRLDTPLLRNDSVFQLANQGVLIIDGSSEVDRGLAELADLVIGTPESSQVEVTLEEEFVFDGFDSSGEREADWGAVEDWAKWLAAGPDRGFEVTRLGNVRISLFI
jgi:hypothetical protein